MSLFARAEVNTGRQVCLDFAKVFALFWMVLSHPFEYTRLDITQGFPKFLMFIGAHPFAAPVFMLCMGIGLAYTRHGDPASLLRRGLRIFAAGYLLNLVRALGFVVAFGITRERDLLYYALSEVFLVDIFHFAGLGLMLFALLKKLRLPYGALLLLAVALSLAGSRLQQISTDHLLADAVLGWFAGIEGDIVESYFPLLNRFIFLVTGYGMGRLLRRCQAPGRLFAILTPVSAALFLGYTLVALPREWGMYNTESVMHFYHLGTFDALICILAMLTTAGIGYFLTRKAPEAVNRFFVRTARNLPRIYILQWILTIWIIAVLLVRILHVPFTDLTLTLAGLLVLVASVWLARSKPFLKLKL